MKIAISGSKGFIGSALTEALAKQGHSVIPIVRSCSCRIPQPDNHKRIVYDPVKGIVDDQAFNGIDGVIHLAGESIAGYWTEAKRRRLYHSRIDSTRLVAQAIASVQRKPVILISASAVGFYGSKGELVTESAPAGDSFLARLCVDWEAAAAPARQAGIRTAQIRLGMVLSKAGGSLKAMLPAFRMGLGTVLGNGRQMWSWISLEDAVRGIQWIIEKPDLSGPINFSSPNPVSNAEFTRELAKICGHKARLRIPAWILRMALDGFASETLLSTTVALPEKLLRSGFEFQHPKLSAYFDSIRL